MNPEIPLSAVWDDAHADAEVIRTNVKERAEKAGRSHTELANWWRFMVDGMLAEWAFFEWTGMGERRRPEPGRLGDSGDVPGGGQIKSAPHIREFPSRKQQRWAIPADHHKGRTVQWYVFIAIERERDLGPANARQLAMAQCDPLIARWISEGRWKEPVATLCGWLTTEEVERLPAEVNEDSNRALTHSSYRKVPITLLRAWPDHPRPISSLALRELLEIEPAAEERQQFLQGMKRSLYHTD